jgi:hypothetical protein
MYADKHGWKSGKHEDGENLLQSAQTVLGIRLALRA